MPPKKTKSSDSKPTKRNSKKTLLDEETEESDDQIKKTISASKVDSEKKSTRNSTKTQSGGKQSNSSEKKVMKKIMLSDSDSCDKELFPKEPIKKKGPVAKEIIIKQEESSEEEFEVKATKNGKTVSNASTNSGVSKKSLSKVESNNEEEDEEEEKVVNASKGKKQQNKENANTAQIGKRPSRNAKKIQYQEDSAEEEDEEEEEENLKNQKDDDFEEEENSSNEEPKNKKKTIQRKKQNKVPEMSDESEEYDEATKKKGKQNKGGKKGEAPEGRVKAVYSADIGKDDNHLIEVQKEQGKVDLEDQYELPYFLTKQYIKDAEGRPINDPNYDPSTLFFPVQELKKETPVFQQYWKVKMQHFDKVIFFRFGRNFMCFFTDALLMKKLFDSSISIWGKRPVASIFDNQYRFYVKELLEKADRSCIVVDQVQYSDDKVNEQDIIKREITQIITKGTFTDYIDNVEDYNARYLMCVVESETDQSFGIALVDCTTHQIYLDDIKNDPAGNQMRTILRKMKPVEIHSVFNNLSEQTKNISKTTCKPQFTFDKTFEFYDLENIFEELKNEYREKIPIENPDKDIGKKDSKMDIEKKGKKGDGKKNGENEDDSDSDDNVENVSAESEDSENDELNDNDGMDEKEKPQRQPKFRYGQLSNDYPILLKDIEEMYLLDKKKFEELHLQQKSNKASQNQTDMEEENEEDPCFDFEYQYYMMLQALMLMLTYLRKLKLNDNVFRLGNFHLLDTNVQKNTYLHLDAHAIENLDIFEVNMQNKVTSEGSLMHFIDYTKTQFGRRMLKRWLAYPLKSIKSIEERQVAIDDLMNVSAVVDQFDKKLSKLGDLERQVSKVFNSSQKSRLKPTSFENFSNVRLKDAFNLVQDLKNLEDILLIFKDSLDNFNSSRLKKLISVKDPEQINRMVENKMLQSQPKSYLANKLLKRNSSNTDSKSKQIVIGLFPDIKPFVELIESQLELDDQGFCQPKSGADKTYDEIVFTIKKIYKKMNNEASIWRKKLNNFDIKLVKSKMQWEIQIPEKLVEGQKKPNELYLTSKIKSYQRFQTDAIIKLCQKLKKAEQSLQKALSPFCEKFFHQFYQNRDLLYQAINCIGELDCLCSLAKCGQKLQVKCKPTFVPDTPNINIFDLREMYHPQLLKENRAKLIPNDTVFENGVQCMLVTGPNMGGKSTLLRQTCLAVILAQLGCHIPARSFKTMIRDRIFCRIGASDRFMEGKSTFLVEMEETGDIVKEATNQSIVLLDELGRGTSTFDGVSIAYGSLRYLVDNIKCLTLFSTHYHMLVDEFRLYKNVQSYLMDFDYDPIQKKMIFKYNYIKGSSEKSFGVNVAKMAGLPNSVVKRAHEKEKYMNSEDQNLGNVNTITKRFNSVIEAFSNNQTEQVLQQVFMNLSL